MADEEDTMELESPSVSGSDDATNPHAVDEDPEQCIGKLIKDPWNDERQEDWPNADAEQEVAE